MESSTLSPVASAAAKNFTLSRKRFQELVTPHTPALILDAEGSIQHATPAARQILEYKSAQPLTTCFFSHVHGKNLYQVMRDVADMVCYGKTSASWLLRLRTGQARWRWYKATVQNRLDRTESAIVITLQDLHDW